MSSVAHLVLYIVALAGFLLFLIQPIYAKFLLPYFGGVTMVWSISIFFFTTSLLIGYAYATQLMRWDRLSALFVHTAVVMASVLLLLLQIYQFDTPLLIRATHWETVEGDVLLSLVAVLFMPVVTLASTSVLLQYIWATVSEQPPYWLYRFSNIGSFLGLLIFPFVLERILGLQLLAWLWATLYILYALLLLLCLYRLWPSERAREVKIQLHGRPAQLWWVVVYGVVPALFLVMITEEVSRGIASFPLLWVLPLASYLLSFVYSFSDRAVLLSQNVSWWLLGTLIIALLLSGGVTSVGLMIVKVVFLTLALFLIATYFHGLAYLQRPRITDLGQFYLALTLGGAVGTGLANFLIPQLLNRVTELPIALIALLIGLLWIYRTRLVYQYDISRRPIIVYAFLVFLAWQGYDKVILFQGEYATRNFYGSLVVAQNSFIHGTTTIYYRSLYNGLITHGHAAVDPSEQHLLMETSYYGPGSGNQIAIAALNEQEILPRVGVVGLGVGTINYYCEDFSEILYVEINPQVYEVAEEQFPYLHYCPEKTSVVIGDGRLELERLIGVKKFDVLVLDAFTDDAIPSHLLTLEAFRDSYLPVLSAQGIVAFHTSNAYLDLRRPLAGIAEALNLQMYETSSENYQYKWVLLSRNELLHLSAVKNLHAYLGSSILWTDNKNSVLSVLSTGGSHSD